MTARRRIVLALLVAAWPARALCDDLDAPDPDEVTSNKRYEYENKYFTIRLGGGLLVDYAHYWQDASSEQQLPLLRPESGIRDLRALVSGRLYWDRLTYTFGYAFNQATNEWLVRQTGLALQVPELGGFLFVGRTKEGFSTSKFMVGYYGWFNERSMVNDAFLPILADGARWTANAFDGALVYNIGAFADPLSESESFNKNDWQVPARVVWLPWGGNPDTGMLHLCAEGRYAGADDGTLQYKSKPESFLAQQNAVDTGKFDAERSMMAGFEAYYGSGPLSIGSEYFLNWVSSKSASNPFFHGGELFASYLFTGETHPYKAKSAYFEDVVPKKTFFAGGPGAWELAVRGSYIDLDSGPIRGGRMFRFTSLVNWYVTETLRLEVSYAYGVLDRFDLVGHTHFLQTRFQLQVK